MRELHYHLVDVFTNERFGGNQLAVFADGRNLTDATMQAIARELNLSETTFVLPPDDPTCDYRVRIFTPARELPMAGHPTVGTAFVLASEHLRGGTEDTVAWRFQEGVGPIGVTVTLRDGQPDMIWMRQPPPTFGPVDEDRAAIAQMLTLSEDDLDPGYPVQEVSTGVPFTFIPLRGLDAARRARVRMDIWERHMGDRRENGLFVFTRETERAGSTVHGRMFAPAFGIPEDPATGAACGPLGCYLVYYGIATGRPARIVCEQGIEMGRPSLIHIEVEREADQFTRVAIGGQCVRVGHGTLFVDD
ncbi:MAG: PhzF family phenazine biosynthesis protein [Chloroflexota bacterium]|mgnify:CR=1 FL=1|nr:MAG: PhzF family phenazine biosynthesis protein [Chloroflexota bacterium]